MTRRILAFALVASVCGCSKKKEEPGKTTGPDGPKPVMPMPNLPAVVEKPAADTTALWALAPADATIGLVLGDGAGKRWLEAGGGALADLAGRPWAGGLKQALESSIEEVKLDWRTPAGWRKAGIDVDKGLALFLDGSQGEPLLAVVPVVDRAAWRTVNDGQLETIDGRQVDRFPKVICTDAGGRYLCARELAVIDAAVKPHDSPLATAVKTLPAGDRGDLEAYADLAKSPGSAEFVADVAPLGEVKLFGGSARLDASGITVRAWLKGKLDGPGAQMVRSMAPSPEIVARTRGATTVWWVRVDPSAAAAVPSEEIAPGLDLKEIAELLAGETALVTVGTGTLGGLALVKVKDAAKAKALVDKVCGMIEEGQLGFKLENLAKKDGSCAGSVEKAAMDALGLPELRVGLALEGPLLALSVGDAATSTAKWMPADMAGSPVTRDLLKGPATMTLWSAALDFDLDALPEAITKDMEKDETTRVVRGLLGWVATHVYELGLGITITSGEARATLRVTTFAADPPAARQAYEAALAKREAKDRAGYTAALAELETKHAGSLVAKRAQQARAGAPLFGPTGALIVGGAAVTYAFTKGLAETIKGMEVAPAEEPPPPGTP